MNVTPTPIQRTIATGDVAKEWGQVTNMQGLISSLCVFGDAVSANYIKILHKRGKRNQIVAVQKQYTTVSTSGSCWVRGCYVARDIF